MPAGSRRAAKWLESVIVRIRVVEAWVSGWRMARLQFYGSVRPPQRRHTHNDGTKLRGARVRAGGRGGGSRSCNYGELPPRRPAHSVPLLRQAASPASDTSTHFGSGAASASQLSSQFHHLYGRV